MGEAHGGNIMHSVVLEYQVLNIYSWLGAILGLILGRTIVDETNLLFFHGV